MKWRSWFKKKPKKPSYIYEVGGGWGNAIEWMDYKQQPVETIVGWKSRIPHNGDLLVCKMQSGKVGVWALEEVDPQDDPRDMFFAKARAIGYADEDHPKKLLDGAIKDMGVDKVPAYLVMDREEYYAKKDAGELP